MISLADKDNVALHVNPAGLVSLRLIQDLGVAVIGTLPAGASLMLGPLPAWRLIQEGYAVEEWSHGDLDIGVREMVEYARLCLDPDFLAKVRAVTGSRHIHTTTVRHYHTVPEPIIASENDHNHSIFFDCHAEMGTPEWIEQEGHTFD